MSAFRRLSFAGGSSDDTEEDRRLHHQHHHPHLYRHKKDYSVSPTGGNRPISVTVDPAASSSESSAAAGAPVRSNTPRPDPVVDAPRKHKSRSDIPREGLRKHKSRSDSTGESRRHKSQPDLTGDAPARKHSSRRSHSSRSNDTDAPVRKHSSKSRKHRPEGSGTAPVAVPVPVPVAAPMTAQMSEPLQMPEPFQTHEPFQLPESPQIVEMPKTSNSPPSLGSSMGIVISGSRERSGSTPVTPMITATPPTPSPLEQARRSNTHPSFSTPMFSPTELEPPPYPVTPPTAQAGADYIAYTVSKMPLGKPEQNSLLDRYRTNFDPRPGTVELSSEPEPVEIGSSDYGSIQQPQRADSGKSFNSGHKHGDIYVNIKRHSSSSATAPTVSRRGLGRNSMRENQYDFLRTFDTVFIIDDSASMEAFTRWSDTRSALETVASIATLYDSDGIDIHFLNSTQHDTRNVKSAAEVRRLFDLVHPAGITPIAACLDRILRDYLELYAAARPTPGSPPMSPMFPGFNTTQYPKPLNIIILTDGEPTDDPESVIVDAARKLDALNAPLHQVGIQFFQIGDEEGAREALEDLDDALAEIYGIRDMVDYTPYVGGRREGEGGGGGEADGVNGEWILKVLMGAVNRRLDRWENHHLK